MLGIDDSESRKWGVYLLNLMALPPPQTEEVLHDFEKEKKSFEEPLSFDELKKSL